MREGLARINKVIDELQGKLRADVAVHKMDVEDKASEIKSQTGYLLEQIKTAKSFLVNPATTYPVKIKSYTFYNREQLIAAVDNAMAQYERLKELEVSTENAKQHGSLLQEQIREKLQLARKIKAKLEVKLAHAGIVSAEVQFKKTDETLQDLKNKTQEVLPDGDISFPSEPATQDERVMKNLDAY